MMQFNSRCHTIVCWLISQMLVALLVVSTISVARSSSRIGHQTQQQNVRMHFSGMTNALYCPSKSGSIYLDRDRVASHFKVIHT
jgi:hypothetical protein